MSYFILKSYKDRAVPCVRHCHTGYDIFHCYSMKHMVTLHWITVEYAVFRIKKCLTNGTLRSLYSLEKWLHNRICYPSNRSKQIQETYIAGTQYTRHQHYMLHRQQVIVFEAMHAVFHSNFAAYIVCRRCKPCEFLGFVWTDC